jgi:hypothetical protein
MRSSPIRLRRALAAAACIAAAASCRTSAGGSAVVIGIPDSVQVRRDIETLASERFEGRRTGTPGNDSAAAYLAGRYAALKLRPAPDAPGCGTGCAAAYIRRFTAAEPVRGGPPTQLPTQNLVGIIPGTDPALRNEYVVVGAHFDHLGRSTTGALDPDHGSEIRNGADDNASGSAAVLALARRFVRSPTRRPILVTHFSGEEEGLLGSAYLVEHPPVPVTRMVAMLNFDMVGRLRDDKVIVYGLATAAEMKSVLDSANAGVGLKLSLVGDGTGPSDHSSFYLKDMPVLHFFTDVHADYHRASDDADKINVAGEVRVVDLAERAIRLIADRPKKLTFTKAPTTTVARSASSGNGAYFGSIPDMGAGDETGMRLSGVSPGGPAEKAGLKGSDLIVEFGGKPIKNIYDYTDALGTYKPGDVVSVVLLRGPNKERITLSVTLSRRGG